MVHRSAYINFSRNIIRHISSSVPSTASATDRYSLELERRHCAYRTLRSLQPLHWQYPAMSLDIANAWDSITNTTAVAAAAIALPRKLQIVSDVHLELYRKGRPLPQIVPHGHDLALLGDIGKPFDKTYHWFLKQQSNQFENVFVLLGNHEFYSQEGRTVPEILDKAKSVCASLGDNVHLLERNTFDITNSTRILGTTLWSAINGFAARSLNDFNLIIMSQQGRKLTQDEYIQWHVRDVAWLDREIALCKKDGKQAVVLTHHGPSLVMAGRFVGSPLNPGFVTNIEHLFAPPVLAFASGHVHSNVDTEVNGIRTVSNALGYPGETTGYKESVIIEIP